MRDVFGHQSFRPGQLEALLPLAHGKDVFIHNGNWRWQSLCMYLVPLSISIDAMGKVPLMEEPRDQQVSL